jgi:hypothetical protein
VHLGGQVGEGDRVGVGQALEHLDDAVLLTDEDTAVRGELDHRRVGHPAEHDRVLEARGQRRRAHRPLRERRDRRHQQQPERRTEDAAGTRTRT